MAIDVLNHLWVSVCAAAYLNERARRIDTIGARVEAMRAAQVIADDALLAYQLINKQATDAPTPEADRG